MQFNDSNLRETPIETKRVFDGVILHIDHITVRLPNGNTSLREVARHWGAAAVVPVDEDGNVYLVRQYRAPFDRILLEIPAGKLDSPTEEKKTAAVRELSEETGFTANNWQLLNEMYTTVGFTDESIGIFLATGLTGGTMHLDDNEFLNVVKMPLADAVAMVRRNEIHDSKTVCSLLLAEIALKK